MSDIEIALLGLLAEKPRYGYELDKIIEQRGMREWTDIAFSSIYAVLRTMEVKRLITASTEIAGNRVRKLFSITKDGRRLLREAVREIIALPINRNDSMMLALAYIKVLPAEEATQALKARLDVLNSRLDHIRTKDTENKKTPANVKSMFERSVAMIDMEIRFAKEMIGEEMEETEGTKETEEMEETEEREKMEEQAEVASAPSEPRNDIKRAADEPKDTLF